MHKYNTNITNISKYDLSVWWLFSICPFPRVTTNKRCHSCTTFSVAATPPPRFILTIENLLRVPFSKVRIVLGPNTEISNHRLTNLGAPTGGSFPHYPWESHASWASLFKTIWLSTLHLWSQFPGWAIQCRIILVKLHVSLSDQSINNFVA